MIWQLYSHSLGIFDLGGIVDPARNIRFEVPTGTDAQWLSGLLRAMGRV